MVEKKNNNKKSKKILLATIFILGLIILLYPIASSVVHSMNQTHLVYDYKRELKKMNEDEKNRQLEEARLYNERLKGSEIRVVDPYKEDKEEESKGESLEYTSVLNVNTIMASIEIPKIGVNIPIYHGTSEKVLQKGVGHVEGTSFPIGGIGNHTVLTAHRGLPSSRLFRNLDKLSTGDKFYIRNMEGIMAYEVDDIAIVLPWETEKIKIHKDKDYATLVTCEPYMINTHRLLVRGRRIPYVEKLIEGDNLLEKTNIFYKYKDLLSLLGIIFISLAIILYRKKKSLKKKVIGND